MAQAYYTYRIRIANRNRVQIEQYDAKNNDRGQPSGQFGYKGKAKIRIQELHQAVRDGSVTGSEIQELGEKLFEILLDPGLRNGFFAFYSEAQEKKALLRIELDVDENYLPEIAALPWEFMRVSPAMHYCFFWLSTHPSLIFSRRRSQWHPPRPIHLANGERLRIGLAVAAPKILGAVKYELVWEQLQTWAKEQQDRVELLEMVNPATRFSFDGMLKREPHILHFIGHGRIKDEMQRDVRQIALVDTVLKDADWLNAEQFVDLFNRHQPGVVLLQTCEGATSSDTDAFIGIASHIVQQNIPVVVAMQYEISNATAQSFSLEFYEQLADNEPVDKAAQEGRRRISLGPLDHETRDFATPMLFMRVRDGRMFISSYTTVEGTVDQTEVGKISGYKNPESSDTSAVKKIQDGLQHASELFSTGRILYKDECDTPNSALRQLGNFLEKLSQKIDSHNWAIAIPLSNVMAQQKELQAALHAFQDSCPPTTKNVPRFHYDKERDAISSKLSNLVTSFVELLRRLELANMLQ